MSNEVRYYEFIDHDYYALVAVEINSGNLFVRPHVEACKVYAEIVAGENYREVLEEADPHHRTKEYAFEKFMRADGHDVMTVQELIKQFDDTKTGVLLIDHSFV